MRSPRSVPGKVQVADILGFLNSLCCNDPSAPAPAMAAVTICK